MCVGLLYSLDVGYTRPKKNSVTTHHHGNLSIALRSNQPILSISELKYLVNERWRSRPLKKILPCRGMNFPYFIAKKVSFSGKKNFSRLIIRIAIVAIALSMTVMIASTSMIQGFKQEITTKIFGFWGHIHINDNNYIRSFESKPININQDFYPSLADVEYVEYAGKNGDYDFLGKGERSKGGISHIQRYGLKEGILEADDDIEGIILKGIWTDYNWEFLRQYMVEGEVIKFPEDEMSRDILVSESTANRLKLAVGDRLTVNFVNKNQEVKRRMTVCGIYKTGLEEYDKRFALVDLRQVQKLLDWTEDQVGGFEVFIDNIDDLDVFRYYLTEERLPLKLYAESIRFKFPGIFEWLELQNINEVVIILLMILVSIINMVTALMILILERTQMVGVLKSLGETDWRIRKIFLYYAAYIIGLGMLWGNLIGIGICLLQKQFGFIKLSEKDYYMSTAPVAMDYMTILGLNLGTMLITLLFLIIPSYLVTSIQPVQALRFK